MSLKDRAKQLKTDIPAVFLALKRKETPWHAKLLAGLTVGYALSPIDLIPDFIPVLGYLDDLILGKRGDRVFDHHCSGCAVIDPDPAGHGP